MYERSYLENVHKVLLRRATIRKASELTDSTIAEASQRLEHSNRRVDMEPSWSRSSRRLFQVNTCCHIQ